MDTSYEFWYFLKIKAYFEKKTLIPSGQLQWSTVSEQLFQNNCFRTTVSEQLFQKTDSEQLIQNICFRATRTTEQNRLSGQHDFSSAKANMKKIL